MSEAEVPEITADEAKEVRKGGGWVVGLGFLTVLLGLFAMGSPAVAGAATSIFVGSFILIGGIFELIHAFQGNGWKAGILAFLGGALSIFCGVFMLARPLHAVVALTLVLAIFFVVDGIGRIVMSFKLKPESGWGVILFSGIITTILGFMIWRQWPVSGLWAIGLLVGIRILFAGISMITLGSVVRTVVPKPAT